MSCAEPISWLRLERYRLDELDAGERATVAEHLTTCPECAAACARIDAGEAVALPPLVPRRAKVLPLRRAVAVGSALLAAAVLVLVVGRAPRESARTKGSDVSFSLVREDEALLAEAGGAYRDGERFKALVTCPPGTTTTFDLVVYENGAAAFPLEPARIACENGAPLGGAFRVTGNGRVVVCLVWPPDREALRRIPRPELIPSAGLDALCKTLEPAP